MPLNFPTTGLSTKVDDLGNVVETIDAATGEDVRTVYSVDMHVQRSFVNDDLPAIMAVRFNLFEFNYGGNVMEKKSIYPEFHVMIPLLFKWLDCEYELRSIIIHIGNEFDRGHFTTFSFHNLKQKWLYVDDAKLKWLKQGEIPAQCKSKIPNRAVKSNGHPYMLFFQKQNRVQ